MTDQQGRPQSPWYLTGRHRIAFLGRWIGRGLVALFFVTFVVFGVLAGTGALAGTGEADDEPVAWVGWLIAVAGVTVLAVYGRRWWLDDQS